MFQTYALPAFFGGVSVSDDDTVTEVKAVTLSYFLEVTEDWQAKLGDEWERKFLEDVEKNAALYYPDLEVSMFVSNTPAWEMEQSKLSVTSTLCINVVVMVFFSLLATVTGDAAKSKPLIGLCGLVSTTMAAVSVVYSGK